MQKRRLVIISLVLLIVAFTLTLAGQALAAPPLAIHSQALTPGRDIAGWSSDIVLPGLFVAGIDIVADSQPMRLRGINMGDPFWARNPDWYPNYSTADYQKLAQDWRANVVRISIFPTQWKNMDHAALLTGLAREVNAALNNGMYVIIVYHVIGWPDGWYQTAIPGNPADTYDSSMALAASFWTQMAQTYGSDNRIIFDLWNEPVHDSSDSSGSDPNPYWPILKGYYETLIQTVRNHSAQNIVLATGNRWASWLVGIKDNPLADPNVVYAYHKYSSAGGPNTVAEWNKDTGGLIGVKPVIVSEWGYEDSDVANPTWPGSQASYGDPFTQWMDSNHLSNLAWMYHHAWTPALLKEDGSLTLYGSFVKQYLISHQYTLFLPIILR
jgi:endoglucanase